MYCPCVERAWPYVSLCLHTPVLYKRFAQLAMCESGWLCVCAYLCPYMKFMYCLYMWPYVSMSKCIPTSMFEILYSAHM